MQRSARRTSNLIFASVIVGFALLIVAAVSVVLLMQRTQSLSNSVEHTYEVETALIDMQLRVERTEVGRRGFLISPTPFFQDVVDRNAEGTAEALARVRDLTADNPAQQQRLAQIETLWTEHYTIMRQSMADRAASGDATAANVIFDENDIAKVRELRRLAAETLASERVLLAQRSEAQLFWERVLYTVVVVTGVLLALVAGSTIVATRKSLTALSATGERLRLLNEDLESVVSERTFELKQANDEIQRFAYIVSHDLRSPLVNVMGFTAELSASLELLNDMIAKAEKDAPGLVTEEARLAVAEDLPEAIGFIRSSTQKMDRLINAILRLSREGRRVLAPEKLDMTALVGGIVDSMQHRLTETGTEIKVDKLPPIVTDRVAIEQILSNLVENSVKYLKPGRPGRVVVTGERRPGRHVYSVADNGRGIDPKDHQRIFDLFRRSGMQDQPGEGIGLAHVRALAYRLGGVVECESTLGEGATFRVSLPPTLRPETEQAARPEATK